MSALAITKTPKQRIPTKSSLFMPRKQSTQILWTVVDLLKSGSVDDAFSYALAFSAVLGPILFTKAMCAVQACMERRDRRLEENMRARQGTPGFALLEPW